MAESSKSKLGFADADELVEEDAVAEALDLSPLEAGALVGVAAALLLLLEVLISFSSGSCSRVVGVGVCVVCVCV